MTELKALKNAAGVLAAYMWQQSHTDTVRQSRDGVHLTGLTRGLQTALEVSCRRDSQALNKLLLDIRACAAQILSDKEIRKTCGTHALNGLAAATMFEAGMENIRRSIDDIRITTSHIAADWFKNAESFCDDGQVDNAIDAIVFVHNEIKDMNNKTYEQMRRIIQSRPDLHGKIRKDRWIVL